ncbi:AAA family ATPase [Planktothrix sp. FACHB-1355]|uniref:Nuclease SbcCD subunit C n=1 Tax=Aerosakkonema funiforme FACHB-1375 TaxID=2949571 RepID=A0A926V9Q4_9CYAN|nr:MULTISPECIES: AAA family ATPase [Oscillatoriales]MBD2179695.1 AAA family ATPase [Aerosakkonema funiforme FACHB-1375]MBD3561122.1 AAA family ATPase [Planktothrix sp. FACHB-1355]
MKLISIKLNNFRCFYGKTPEILLCGEEQRNTTIIHGNNGAGKTTLLNAFTWVLYEKFTAAFASEEQLVNKRAIAEAKAGESVECWVEIVWEHDDKRYRAKRECRAYKSETIEQGESRLYMQVAGDDGRWQLPQQHPDDIIGRILPETLHQYFFFDGERIDRIVRSDNKLEIAEATKTMLGMEVLDRSIKHLKEAKKTLEEELKAIGDTETRQLLKQKDKKEQEVEKLTNRQTEIGQELSHQQTLKKETSNRFRDVSGAKDLEERRKELSSQKATNRDRLKQSREALNKAISTRGYTTLLPEITAEFRAIVSEFKQRGELTSGISREFINDLLNSQRCICGAELREGTHLHHNVSSWLDKASIAAVEETAIRTIAQVDEIDKQTSTFWQDIDKEQANINQIRQEISRIETQLDDIGEQLRKNPAEEIRNLQKRLDEIEGKIRDLTLEEGENKQKISDLKTEIDELSKQIAKQEMNEARQALAQRRIAATQDAIERLTEFRSRLDKHFRSQLEKRVQDIFSSISFKPYLPKLTDKYELTLVEKTAGKESQVAASTGENQILSLSFIGGIIDRVREWSKEEMMMPNSSTFPIVMDSPFGSLDEIYRRQIAKIIPKLANQLVVLVTKTQWRGEVEEEMANRVGREYVLTYYSSKPDCEADTIELGGLPYSLVRQSPNEFEYTEIVEVDYEF